MNNEPIKIIIIGGGTAGISAATRARRINENAEITIIEESGFAAYPMSALPSFVSGLIKHSDFVLPNNEEYLSNVFNLILIKNHRVLKINKEAKNIHIQNLKTNIVIEKNYDTLIISTGIKFSIPKFLNVQASNFFILKNLDDAINIRQFIEKTSIKNITLIGSNFFSLNLANSFLQNGFNVSIIEKSGRILNDFDDEFNYILKEEIIKSGIKFYPESQIRKFIKTESGTVNKIETNFSFHDVQLVIYCDNIAPNSDLASFAKLQISNDGGIVTDKTMQTSCQGIFAAGSCAQTFHSISSKPEISFFIGPTQFQGRVAGTNAASGMMNFTGVLGTNFMNFNGFCIGITGLTEEKARLAGFKAVSLTTFNGNRERFMHGSTKLHSKIVYDSDTRQILGALVCGNGDGVDKRLDVFSTAIYSKLVVDDLINLNLCYSPEISTYKDPVNVIGMVAANRLDHISTSIKLNDINFSDDIVLLDVRSKSEFQKEHLLNSLWIPLLELRARLNEVPTDKPIYIYGHVGMRGYIAERILKGRGYEKVFNIDGGMTSIKISENLR
jgi:NADPH-dependent 2,4-dienoyl-CoA reductase/sulfur reductase-like enzyme/rhodanese-related sulfurtransferase